MKKTYPAILTPAKEEGYTSFVPDFEINTQGNDLAGALENTADAIGIIGIDMEDEGKKLPEPSKDVPLQDGETVYFVDVDFLEYRIQNIS